MQHMVTYASVVQRIGEQIQTATQLMMIVVKVMLSANVEDFLVMVKNKCCSYYIVVMHSINENEIW